ncbi:amino acid ABC transporter permease [Salipiger sp. PrR002]|uniref:amino acid ABC transporter permease n=1 Tax=Salipiger sp. PrR002 TaxID=2706489 RepID=UPI0013BC140A|nr:amino acid ABC transporter permease [Salipiger sp. PrR002]NDW01906.1 amino acid ABC transporter permease [Salipiger sp. PrR002]NDW59064.1 amino acid ABC transporter permease [Salipiger sp. PrR004]
MYQWDFLSVWEYRDLLLSGLKVTLLLAVAVIVVGLILGTINALGALSKFAPIRYLSISVIELFRCTPVLVTLIWIYYALPILIGVEISAMMAAFLAIMLYGAAFYSEIVRAGIQGIDPGQAEAGAAIGLTEGQVLRRIILPQAIRKMVPPLVNQSVINLKNTSLVSVLAVPDLLYEGKMISHETFRPLEVFTTVALIYFAILFPLTMLVRRLEAKHGVKH